MIDKKEIIDFRNDELDVYSITDLKRMIKLIRKAQTYNRKDSRTMCFPKNSRDRLNYIIDKEIEFNI